MTKVTCPVCKSSVDRLPIMGGMLPPEFDDLGVPIACAATSGFGLPIVTPGNWLIPQPIGERSMTEQMDHIPDAGKMVLPDPVSADLISALDLVTVMANTWSASGDGSDNVLFVVVLVPGGIQFRAHKRSEGWATSRPHRALARAQVNWPELLANPFTSTVSALTQISNAID